MSMSLAHVYAIDTTGYEVDCWVQEHQLVDYLATLAGGEWYDGVHILEWKTVNF